MLGFAVLRKTLQKNRTRNGSKTEFENIYVFTSRDFLINKFEFRFFPHISTTNCTRDSIKIVFLMCVTLW